MFVNKPPISLEAFTVIEFKEIFSVRQPRQNVKISDVSGKSSIPIFTLQMGNGVTSQNIGKSSQIDAAVCTRKFH